MHVALMHADKHGTQMGQPMTMLEQQEGLGMKSACESLAHERLVDHVHATLPFEGWEQLNATNLESKSDMSPASPAAGSANP